MRTGMLNSLSFLDCLDYFFNLIWPSWWEISLTLPTGGSYKVHQGLSAGPLPACKESTAQHTTMMGATVVARSREGLSLVLQHSPSQSYPWQQVSHVDLKLLPWAALNDEGRSKNAQNVIKPVKWVPPEQKSLNTSLLNTPAWKSSHNFHPVPSLKRLEFS